jgi:catechol 2,3-dioxygenase-like lactoylglutathione lyase family enzyme
MAHGQEEPLAAACSLGGGKPSSLLRLFSLTARSGAFPECPCRTQKNQQFSRSQPSPKSVCSGTYLTKETSTMITRMSHATVWVKNQQEALEFYRDKLGFEVDTDAMVGDDFRWLTMRIPTQPGFEIILMEPKPGYILDEDSAAQLKALMEKGVLGGGVFETDDIQKTYEELKAKGVEFKGPPTTQDWGTATVMKDNSGNWFSVGQDKKE